MQTRINKPKHTPSTPVQLMSPSSGESTGVIPMQTTQTWASLSADFKSPRRTSRSNRTGIPDSLKAKVEEKSGLALDDVQVHRDSDEPSGLGALAYTKGNQVYLSPGQDKHLEHELGHVVQQKQGRVRPTMQLNGTAINDDDRLEQEADTVAERGGAEQAVQYKSDEVVQRLTPCDVQARFTEIPRGEVTVEHSPWFGGKWGASFNMRAEFTPKDSNIKDGDCSSGEYRQFVKGKFMINGKKFDHYLYNDRLLDENEFRLDGSPGHYYGEKAWRSQRASRYDHKDNISTFTGSDFPGIETKKAGEIDLEFRGMLIDGRKPKQVLTYSDWTMKKVFPATDGSAKKDETKEPEKDDATDKDTQTPRETPVRDDTIQGKFLSIKTPEHQNILKDFIHEHGERPSEANANQVVNDIVHGRGTHTEVNGENLLHASAGNRRNTVTAFFRYITRDKVLILAVGHHLDATRYRLDYRHAGFNGNEGDNFINLNRG